MVAKRAIMLWWFKKTTNFIITKSFIYSKFYKSNHKYISFSHSNSKLIKIVGWPSIERRRSNAHLYLPTRIYGKKIDCKTLFGISTCETVKPWTINKNTNTLALCAATTDQIFQLRAKPIPHNSLCNWYIKAISALSLHAKPNQEKIISGKEMVVRVEPVNMLKSYIKNPPRATPCIILCQPFIKQIWVTRFKIHSVCWVY